MLPIYHTYLSAKGVSVVSVLQSICSFLGAYFEEDNENSLEQCKNRTIKYGKIERKIKKILKTVYNYLCQIVFSMYYYQRIWKFY